MIRILAAAILFSAILFPQLAAAIDPRWAYRTLYSPNFELIYREDQKLLAKRYIVAAEQAHELLMPIFKEGPRRTIVVLQDDTDLSNGLANFIPYAHIVIYPVLPTQGDSTDEYGDWPLEVMIHEYAHILNMYPAHGIYWPFKYIFGSVIRPNAILPRWWLEGLAVDLESRLSNHGRLRSSQTQAQARAFVLSDKMKTEDVATINEVESRTYPFGARPYLYGGWWWSEAHGKKGDELIYTFNQNFSRRLPFLLNGPTREQLGQSVSQFFSHTKRVVASQAQQQIDTIKKAGATESADAQEGDGQMGAFAFSPDSSRLIYSGGIVDQGTWIYLSGREDNSRFTAFKGKKLIRTVGTTKFAWINNDQVVFDQLDMAAPYTNYRDLFRYDFKAKDVERLTKGQRAQEPSVSPNGQLIAYIQNDGGRNRVNVLDLKTMQSRTLVNGNFSQRLASPEFLTDTELLFCARTKNGDEKIFKYDFASGKSSVWNAQLKHVQDLRRTSAGILASDAGTGVRNIYRVTANSAEALTNVLTVAHSPDFDPRNNLVVYNEFTGTGTRLKSLELKPRETPPKIQGPDFEAPIEPDVSKVKIEEGGFWPIMYLRPRYWIPWIYPTEGGVLVQGTTAMSDPIGRNRYSLFGSYDSVTQKPSYGVGYQNRSFPIGISADYSKYVTYLTAGGTETESNDGGFGFFGNLGTRYTAWNLNGIYSETQGLRSKYKRMGPEARLEYSGLSSPYRGKVRWHLEGSHRQFLEQDGYLAYGRSYAHIAMLANIGSHKLGIQARGAVSPELGLGNVIELGDRNVGGNYLVNLANSSFLLRGYPSGTFVGRRIVNGNIEYVLPASEIGAGFGTFPLFLRNLELAAFFDAMAVDGAGFNTKRGGYIRSHLREFYTGAGAEIRLNTTMGYHLPLAITTGLYYGLNSDYGGGFTFFLGIGLGSLSPIH